MTDIDGATHHYINYLNLVVYPEQLDATHGYLLENGYYNYQEYINYQAKKAQNGNSESLERCLYYFGWRGEGAPGEILGYYYDQLVSGGIDISRPDALNFIRLFSKENEREQLKGKRVSHIKARIATRKMNNISNRLSNYKSREDIKNDLIDLLMDRILKYKPGKRTLRKYVYDLFYLYVGDYVQRTFRQKDYMNIQYARAEPPFDDYMDITEFPVTHTSEDTLYEWEKEKEMLGPFWVSGHTHPIFKNLTRTERMILRDNYFYKIPERTLVDHYHISRDLIKNRKKSASRKIEEALETKDDWLIEQEGYAPLDREQ